jgi:nicotinamidase-related amidase
MTPVVIVLNMQNEIVHPDGVIAARGNAARVSARGVLENTASLCEAVRRTGTPAIYAGSGYDDEYRGLNRSVPQFGPLEQKGLLRIGTWGAEFHETIAPKAGDVVFYRGGLGLFAASPLGAHLPPPADTRVYLAGVSTRLVVEAAVFELTDRGYAVTVVEDCCAAATDEAHTGAIAVLSSFATIESASGAATAIGRMNTDG